MAMHKSHHVAITIHCFWQNNCHCADSCLTCYRVVSHTGTISTMCWNYQFRQWELLVPFVRAVVKHALYQAVKPTFYRYYTIGRDDVMVV